MEYPCTNCKESFTYCFPCDKYNEYKKQKEQGEKKSHNEAQYFEMLMKLSEEYKDKQIQFAFALVEKLKEKDREIERLQAQLGIKEAIIEDLKQKQQHSLDDDLKYRAIVSILNSCITNLSFDTEGRWSLEGFLRRGQYT